MAAHTKKGTKRIYWDSCVFLRWLREEQGHEEAAEVLRLADAGTVQLVTSAFTLTEVLHRKGETRLEASRREAVEKVWDRSGVTFRSVDRQVGQLAFDLAWDAQIAPKDAVHMATALAHGVEEFHTFDTDLLKLGDAFTYRDLGPVRCMKPAVLGAMRQIDGFEAASRPTGHPTNVTDPATGHPPSPT